MFEYRKIFDGRILASDGYSFNCHLQEMVCNLGPPPVELLLRAKLGGYYFDAKSMIILLHTALPTKNTYTLQDRSNVLRYHRTDQCGNMRRTLREMIKRYSLTS